ncbi:Uncharacterised protein [Klebsiella michiganensis]|nr:Uncharacterised protein [Klebsiella michiganensis]
MHTQQGISWCLNMRRMFTVINPLGSADFAIADFSLKEIVFNALLKVAAAVVYYCREYGPGCLRYGPFPGRQRAVIPD